MNQEEKFNDILNECLDRLFKGDSVERCLQDYPEQASELEPLLRTAVAARVFSTVQPRSEFKARARYQFQSALRDMEAKKSRRRSFFNWQWRPQLQTGWAVSLVAAIAVVLGGGGTVVAASSSMPDQALYSVKLATESVQLAVTPSDIGKVELNAKFANRRVAEIEYLAGQGNAQDVQSVVARLNVNLENMTLLAGGETVMDGSQPADINVLAAPSDNANKSLDEPRLGVASMPASSAPAQGSASPESSPEPTAEIALAVPPSVSGPRPTETAPDSINPGSPLGGSKSFESSGTWDSSDILETTLSPEQEKLKKIITDSYLQRQAVLEKALKKASPDARPAVRQAIAQSEAEYLKAIRGLLSSSAP
jgi:hypothetical protein